MKSLLHMHLNETKYCFVCGPENSQGLKLTPYIEDGNVVVASYIAPIHLCSYKFKKAVGSFKALLHGGIQCALLDCLSAWIFFALRKQLVVTTEFDVKLMKPLFVKEKMYLRAEIVSENDDGVIVRGEIRNNRRELCTVSKIKYKVLSKELMKKFVRQT